MTQFRHDEFNPQKTETGAAAMQSRSAHVRHETARIISSVIHPIIFPLFTIMVIAYSRNNDLKYSLILMLIALVVAALPLAALVIFQVRRGHWTDLDVSQRTQRYFLYPFSIISIILVLIIYAQLRASYALLTLGAMFTANVINGFVNLKWKISAHATAAAACATLLWLFTFVWGPLAAIAAILVSWSRVELGRHTTGQVIAGSLVGFTSALAIFELFH